MSRPKRNIEAFSLSFLDAITCAFGAVILLLVLTKIYEPQIIERSKEQLIGLIAALQQQLFEMRGEVAVMNRELLTVEEQLLASGSRLSSLRQSMSKAQGKYDALQIELQGDTEDHHESEGQRETEPERQLKLHQQPPAGPGSNQEKFTLSKIDHPGRLVDQHETHRHHPVEGTDNHAVDDQLH